MISVYCITRNTWAHCVGKSAAASNVKSGSIYSCRCAVKR